VSATAGLPVLRMMGRRTDKWAARSVVATRTACL
jgi:hypothetical protein